MLPFALLLALVWGGIWAGFLQFSSLGRFLAKRRTWLTVVIGLGVDLLIALLVVTWEMWVVMAAIVATSSVGIIGRSLWNEWNEWGELVYGNQDAIAE